MPAPACIQHRHCVCVRCDAMMRDPHSCLLTNNTHTPVITTIRTSRTVTYRTVRYRVQGTRISNSTIKDGSHSKAAATTTTRMVLLLLLLLHYYYQAIILLWISLVQFGLCRGLNQTLLSWLWLWLWLWLLLSAATTTSKNTNHRGSPCEVGHTYGSRIIILIIHRSSSSIHRCSVSSSNDYVYEYSSLFLDLRTSLSLRKKDGSIIINHHTTIVAVIVAAAVAGASVTTTRTTTKTPHYHHLKLNWIE